MKVNGKRITVLSAVLILVAALYGVSLFVRRADMTMSMPSLFRPAQGSRLFMSIEGFRFTQSENGRVAWRMHARNAELYENKEARLKDLEITFIAPDKREAVLIGDTGTMDTATGNASVLGVDHEVRILTSDGYLLTTHSLFWKASRRLVDTPDPFKLLGREIYLEGKGLSANVELRTIVVNDNVKAVLQE
jgi:LPS export ABC transporter protein LptC